MVTLHWRNTRPLIPATCAPLAPSFLCGTLRLSELCPQWTSRQLQVWSQYFCNCELPSSLFTCQAHWRGIFVASWDAAIEIPSNAVGTCPGRWWYWSSVKY